VKLHDLILVEPETLNLDLLIYLVMFLWPKIFTDCKKIIPNHCRLKYSSYLLTCYLFTQLLITVLTEHKCTY